MGLPLLRRLRLPSRIAMLLGLSAFSAPGAQADTAHLLSSDAEPQSRTERMSFGQLQLASADGRLYLVETGSEFQELRLGDTAEARRLRSLLRQNGVETKGVRLDRMILAGGGGKGISWGHWKPVRSERSGTAEKSGGTRRTTAPDANTPRRASPSGSTNLPVAENKK